MKPKGKVVLGMSGGVDSSVAALLLKKQGYDVYGYFMNCGVRGKSKLWESSIDWKKDEKILRGLCKKLGVKLFMADCEIGYEKKIIQPMFKDYGRGLTPNPDILCNNVGKFPNLIKKADEIGAKYIATGHYARVKKGKRGFELLRGKDREKDQSYFICGLTQKILSRVIFPLGDLTKEEVRKIAKKNGFENWEKRSSRGVCYLGKIDMKKFLGSRIKERRGEVISSSGEVIGSHPGQMFFTIGERVGDKKGFEIDKKFRNEHKGKLYVAKKLRGNKLVVAEEGDDILKTKKIALIKLKLINTKGKIINKKYKARIRHLGELNSGKIIKDKGKLFFVFDKGIEGVAEGQTIVLYDGERVVGCGEMRLR